MFYRLFITAIVAFWLVMTVLLVRKIHFPQSLSRTLISDSLVIDTFFGQDRPGGEFTLLQNNQEIGIVNIIPRERKTAEGIIREIVLWNGGAEIHTKWNALVTLSQDSKTIAGFELQAAIVGSDLELEISAKPGTDSIDYVVKNAGQIVIDSKGGAHASALQEQTARTVLASMGFQADDKTTEDSSSGEINTYEETIAINGRQRDVYTLVASLGPGREITAHFNRSGEILAIYSFFNFELRPAAIILDP